MLKEMRAGDEREVLKRMSRCGRGTQNYVYMRGLNQKQKIGKYNGNFLGNSRIIVVTTIRRVRGRVEDIYECARMRREFVRE